MNNVETSLESLGFYNSSISSSSFNLGSLVSTPQTGGAMGKGAAIGMVSLFILLVFIGGLLLGLERKKLKDNCDDNKAVLDPLDGKTLKTADGIEVKIESSDCENKPMYLSGIALMVCGLLSLCLMGMMLAGKSCSADYLKSHMGQGGQGGHGGHGEE